MRTIPRLHCTQPGGWAEGGEVKAGVGQSERQLTLYSVFLHFLDLGDGLSQVVGELLAVLRVGRVEVDEDLDVGTWYR